MFPVLGHPMMQPDVGFIELPARLSFLASVVLLPEHAAMRTVNRPIDKKRKKKKDEEKAKRWAKERAKLDRGRWWQGSEEEEEEEREGGDGSRSPV